MTKKSFFLFSTLVLAGLAQTPSVTATTDTASSSSAIVQETPNTVATLSENIAATSLVTTEQSDQALSIFYQRPQKYRSVPVHHAIWSIDNGQDDLRWYLAGDNQTDIPLAQLGASGTYVIHTYAVIDGQNIFVSATSVELTQPSTALSTTISAEGTLDISITHIPLSVTEVLLPTWSDKNWQDDIEWYSTKRNSDGTAQLRISLKKHQFDTGIYHTHLYFKENTKLSFISQVQTTVSSQQLPALQPPIISIQSVDGNRGTYQVQVKEQANTKPIKSVDIATWSTSNQSNIKWRTAAGGNGDYRSDISFQEHQNHAGHYQNHVYVTYADGSKVGYVASTVDLTKARVPVSIQTRFVNTGNFQVTIGNVTGAEPVRYAVWSDQGGQDDIHWYDATKSNPTSYTGDIPLVVHNSSGTYHLHVYQGNVGLGTTTFHVAENQKNSSGTTYPVGECTWGAKMLAPWAGEYWGNGAQWADSARRAGFRVGTTPKIGAIAVWPGGFGHVAVVVDVQNNNRIRVKEANYAGRRYIADFRGWFNPASSGVIAYIYPN